MDLIYQTEYCPPIDPALFSAIVSDYDLNSDNALQEVRATLDLLKSTAVAEEATGFDPSGSSARGDGYSPNSTVSIPDASQDASAVSTISDATSLSNAVSSIDLTDDNSASAIKDLEAIEQLDVDAKSRLLKDLFPSLSEFTITHTLKTHRNGWRRSLDDLLNQVYLSDNKVHQNGNASMAKGIEAFTEDNNAVSLGRKKKKKGKNLRIDDDGNRANHFSGPSSVPPPATNRWQAAGKNIDFISDHLRMPAQKVSSIYYQHDASFHGTITSILDTWLEHNKLLAEQDPSIQVDAYELGNEFPTLPEHHRVALIGITQPSTAGAYELASALATRQDSGREVPLKVIPQYVPLRIEDDDHQAPYVHVLESSLISMDFGAASSKAYSLDARRSAALTQARAAYLKSKSNSLMGGAAAYYSQVGRDLRDSSHVYSAAAADSLVASQSGPSHIDLHGVTVDDALRISRARVNQWWERLGESRYNGRLGADDRAAGFRIVTGAGKHSKGGRGVLGPAVKKLLTQDGWRIEAMSGGLLVKGKY